MSVLAAIHPAVFIVGGLLWTLAFLIIACACRCGARDDLLEEQAAAERDRRLERECQARLRPRSNQVTASGPDPRVVALMRQGMPADAAVRRVFDPRNRGVA